MHRRECRDFVTPQELAHWILTMALGGLLGVVSWVFTTSRAETNARVQALENQNTQQETAIATLRAEQRAHDGGFERVESAVARLDSKIDGILVQLGRRMTPYGSGSDSGRKT
jgi:uncharacterized protein HemX